jgi:hypothetical protein
MERRALPINLEVTGQLADQVDLTLGMYEIDGLVGSRASLGAL